MEEGREKGLPTYPVHASESKRKEAYLALDWPNIHDNGFDTVITKVADPDPNILIGSGSGI